MTRELLIAASEARPKGPAGIVTLTVALLLVPLALLVDVLRLVGRLIRLAPRPPASAECSGCSRTVELSGTWECGGCGGCLERHAFEPCPLCGAISRFVSCACGTAIPNRWVH